MSRTDNTRPWLLQAGDTTAKGEPDHYHQGDPCDYHPRNNLTVFREEQSSLVTGPRMRCTRIVYRYGGKRADHMRKDDRKLERREIRQRVRQELHRVRVGQQEDFYLSVR